MIIFTRRVQERIEVWKPQLQQWSYILMFCHFLENKVCFFIVLVPHRVKIIGFVNEIALRIVNR